MKEESIKCYREIIKEAIKEISKENIDKIVLELRALVIINLAIHFFCDVKILALFLSRKYIQKMNFSRLFLTSERLEIISKE